MSAPEHPEAIRDGAKYREIAYETYGMGAKGRNAFKRPSFGFGNWNAGIVLAIQAPYSVLAAGAAVRSRLI